MAKTKITLKDIAAHANVSVSTVSRVLNQNYDMVSEDIRRAVEQAMQDLHYTPAIQKKAVKKEVKPFCIGVLLSDIDSEAMGLLLGGILSVAEHYDADVIVKEHKHSAVRERRALELFLQSGVDAIIATAFDVQNLDAQYLWMAEKGFPMVLVTNDPSDIVHENIFIICNDTTAGSLTGYQYLLGLGHRRIMLLGVPGERQHHARRIEAIKAYCNTYQYPFYPELMIDCKDSYEGALAVVNQICKEGSLQFTAIFAMSDTIAFGAWDALENNGLRVCEDVSILGYDDLRAAVYKQLTTLAEPMRLLGTSAANLVVNMLNGYQTEPQKIVLQDSLQIRFSCRRIVD